MFKNLLKSMFSLILVSMLAVSFVSCFENDDDDDDGTGGGTYYLTATIDGNTTTFDGGFTEAGNVPIAGYDTDDDCTSIYAFDPSISFSDIYTSGTGILISDFDGQSAGTCSTCTVNYLVDGVSSVAVNCPVTIDAYGAEGEAVSGQLDTGCIAGAYTITDLTFVVKNYGEED